MKLTVFGAARTVTGSMHLIEHQGHKLLLDHLKVKPLLNLGLRLGEGSGAICAYPIVESAVRMINEMNTFSNAAVTKYF